MRLNLTFCLVLVAYLSLINIKLNAQSFVHIEGVSGLSSLSENNGVAVADYDGDLDLDIFVVAKSKDEMGVEKSHSKLFRNENNGTFTDVTSEAGLMNLFTIEEEGPINGALDGFKYGVSWGDYDNDGLPDLFFTNVYKVQLFHNQGNGTFIERTEEAGFDRKNTCVNTGATWFDYNNDGFLDIYIGDWGNCDYNSLYVNNGDGTFRNVSNIIRSNEVKRKSYLSIPFDFNNDGWMDLYITNDDHKPNELFINDNGTSFSEQAQNYGIDNDGTDMGLSIGDFNNDGFFDMYITNIESNILLKNNGNNNFIDVAIEKKINNTGWAWDTTFSDFDLDGDEDLFVVNGFTISKEQENSYFENLLSEGLEEFANTTESVQVNELTMSIGATPFDYDNDGDLDLFVTNSDQDSYFYGNQIISGDQSDEARWFKIALQGTTSNRDAIGTKVSIKSDLGTIHRYYTGVGFLSQSLQPVHFGLGKANMINEVIIKWPSGQIDTYQNLEPNQYIKATENQGYKILNVVPSEMILGCTDPNSCNYNPLATADNGSCMYLSPNEIIGSINSGFNRTESYSTTIDSNTQATWTVEGGAIVSGQNTGTIVVKWGLNEHGTIKLERSNGLCISKTLEVNVALSLDKVFNDISVARIWNEALLDAIRNDLARPTVHARNLFHTSVALYDAWALYDQNARPYLVGNNVNGFNSEIDEFIPSENMKSSQEKAMSYAAYRILNHRFKGSPGAESSLARFEYLMNELGYDTSFNSISYQSGDAAALGNFIAQIVIDYGASDGSNEANDYINQFYNPVNPPLNLYTSELSGLVDPNRWQPLTFDTFIDQSGNIIPGDTPEFLGPEWGNVFSFALSKSDRSRYNRNSNAFTVYHDPGVPPELNLTSKTSFNDLYKWNFSLVSIWSAHMDPNDGVLWDISPSSIGNIDIDLIPDSFEGYHNFYKEFEGGDISKGHRINPSTGQAYTTQMVPRGDYARVLAEFWADGPDSETPPGHWFTILNYVNDHPLFSKKFNGIGEVLSPLEWDVKAYFILAGAMHDAAVTAWGIKGWYDYIRPISAIRYMSELGQSSDPLLSNYHLAGIPLVDGYIEIIQEGDDLAGDNSENVGEIKLYAWKGHDYIDNSETDVAGVGWILAKNWWPYQRPSFVTPPFAGYVSGHSTFSRAAAEVMTLLTGDAFFPGGMGEFVAKKDVFLAFEKGPSVDVVLQWATYRDASDQTSLSRIWGGIHPPVDDLPGRLIGEQIGIDAYNFAVPYFSSNNSIEKENHLIVYPNPVKEKEIRITNTTGSDRFQLFDITGKKIFLENLYFSVDTNETIIKLPNSISAGLYVLAVNSRSKLLVIED